MAISIACPLRTVDIRNIAKIVREKLLGIPPDRFINMADILDVLSFKLSKHRFDYVVLPDGDSIFKEDEEAKTNIVTGEIFFKESVIQQATHKRYCRANFTIAHEIGHFVLHRVFNLITFSRGTSESQNLIYRNPEWQADTFASELLMSYEECLDLSPEEIRRKYHVSKSAAQTRYNKLHQ